MPFIVSCCAYASTLPMHKPLTLVPLRLERGNLFEDLCNLISKTACPVAKGALTSLHFISLEAMHAVMQASERGGRGE